METIRALEAFAEYSGDFYEKLKKTLVAHEELRETFGNLRRALKEARKSLGVHENCGVCYQRVKNTALNCGHLQCLSCAQQSLRAQRCPFCRKPTTELLKVFL